MTVNRRCHQSRCNRKFYINSRDVRRLQKISGSLNFLRPAALGSFSDNEEHFRSDAELVSMSHGKHPR